MSRHESLQKKRISWGPSKILEFFPAEQFNVNSNDSSMEIAAKANNDQPKKQTGGILKNKLEENTTGQGKRVSHLI